MDRIFILKFNFLLSFFFFFFFFKITFNSIIIVNKIFIVNFISCSSTSILSFVSSLLTASLPFGLKNISMEGFSCFHIGFFSISASWLITESCNIILAETICVRTVEIIGKYWRLRISGKSRLLNKSFLTYIIIFKDNRVSISWEIQASWQETQY